jgi:uncharacterized protein YggE
MRIVIAVVAVAAFGLIADGLLGVATGETSTAPTVTQTPPLRTVSVQGFASETIPPEASTATADSVYHQGLADAVSDGQGKAQLLAEKSSATLGPVQSIGEGGGYIDCPEGQEYEGVQPDFGSAGTVGPVSAPAVANTVVRKPAARRPRRHHTAKKASGVPCTLYAQVSLVYQLS